MTDMTNQAIKWTSAQKSLTPDKPFFTYFAPGATHAPHHVPKEWIAKYKGKFDQGWDKLREETLARQIKLGVVPAGTKLAPKPEAIKDWDKLSADEKKLFARQMEVFAGFGEYADYEIGRLIQAIEDLGQLDNTLIFYDVGDNGASAEGTHERPVQRDDLLQRRARNRSRTFSSTTTNWAARTPTRTTPPVGPWRAMRRSPGRSRSPAATAARRNPLVVHWPKGIKAKGEVRSQWHHVIDIAPTILEAAGLPEPKSVERHAADAHRRREHGLHVRRRRGEDRRTRRSTSRSSATAASTTTAGWPTRSTAPPGRASRRAVASKTSGNSTTSMRTSVRRTTWPRRTPRSSRNCRSCS